MSDSDSAVYVFFFFQELCSSMEQLENAPEYSKDAFETEVEFFAPRSQSGCGAC